MKKLIVAAGVLSMIFTMSCSDQPKSETDAIAQPEVVKEEPKPHWSYDGETSPEHWAELEKESSCGGNRQSPIDIVTSDVVSQPSGLNSSDIHYDSNTIIHDVTNNGHSLQYNFDSTDNYVNFGGKRYDLAQFHFHAASEHSINGEHAPLEIHFVHVSSDKDFLVLSVMVTEGGESKAFDFLEQYLPVNPGETKAIGLAHHFNIYLVDDFSHYYYQGSLTTPPCTESVHWFIFKDAIKISQAQVQAIASLMPRNNYRPTQPLNDRKVYVNN